MAFNGSGTFVRVYNFATDKTNLVPVTASRMDTEFDGIATGLSTAIAKDGQTPTTARIPFAAGASAFGGAVGGVSYAQTNDPNTGVYFPAADQVSLAAGGVAALAATATTVTVPVDLAVTGDIAVGDDLVVTGDLTVSGALFGVIPAGLIAPYAGSAAPTGWLICDGSSLLRTDYAALFTAIGTTYGSADGTHFTLPDMKGRIPAGKESSATRLTSAVSGVDGGTLGATGGSQSHTLTTAQLASHSHTGTTGDQSVDHTHQVTALATSSTGATSGASHATGDSTLINTGGVNQGHTHSFTTATEGSGTAHNNVQPTIVLNYIIKT